MLENLYSFCLKRVVGKLYKTPGKKQQVYEVYKVEMLGNLGFDQLLRLKRYQLSKIVPVHVIET